MNLLLIIYIALWLGISVPILLSVVFGLLKPILIADPTGISMILIALFITILDAFIGIKLIDKFQLRRK